MPIKVLTAFVLSVPATVAVLGLAIVVTPASSSLSLTAMLMFFPLWVSIVCAVFLLRNTLAMAAILAAISAAGFGLIALLKFLGLAML